jgi:hypothetical protein
MIQAIISRLASQSTTIKGWCVTVTAALLGFGTTTTPVVALIAIYVVLAFATLDAYYLSLERNYRTLYQHAANGHTTAWTLTINQPRPRDIAAALRSPAIAILYGTSLLTTATITIYLLLK